MSTVTFAAETTKNFVPNTRRGSEYSATIQNLTANTIVITVTNEDIQGSTPQYGTPQAGAVSIPAAGIGAITQPYGGWLITAAVSTSGTVEITEAG